MLRPPPLLFHLTSSSFNYAPPSSSPLALSQKWQWGEVTGTVEYTLLVRRNVAVLSGWEMTAMGLKMERGS